MLALKTILYATDFSESSGPAADYAFYLARLTGARLHVLHVVGELADHRKNQVQPEAFNLLEREVETQAVKEIETFCQRKFNSDISYTTEVVIGRPFDQILRKSRQLPADMIVLGTHGRTGIEHVLVGSTAERVVRRATVPVLTVRSSV
ncbi:MAG: universal stress protein [Desulfuromonadales bacterium]